MTEHTTICPTCEGKKVIHGVCSCNMEWRGNKHGEDWEDCQCTPDIKCPAYSGTGSTTGQKTCH
ncbi:MAG: ankyrin [Proteobacteria bacterium]|nr:ankyrin [Pseudomonadota bacterium]MBU1688702.1 ankyrin [Pseudomonadota bacterium]